jgi:flagellin-like hook-associated protein FlgL
MTISLTRGMKDALSSLNDLQVQIKTTNNRLATGKKVNSALDNALSFFVAESFNSKARGLATIQDNIGLGLNVLKQTDKALTSITRSLEQAEGTLRAALNTAGTNARATTTFSFRDASGAASAAALLAEGPATSTTANRFQVGDVVTFNLVSISSTGVRTGVGTGTALTIAGTTTVQNLLDGINTNVALNPAGQASRVSAYLNDSGNIVIENNISGRDAGGNTFALEAVVNTGATGATNNTLDIFSFSGAVGGAPTSTGSGTQTVTMLGSSTMQETRNSAAAAFREVLNQVRNSALDAGFNGTNLLQGDFLRVGFNEENTTSLTTQGRRLDAGALGFSLDNASTQSGDAARNFQSDREISNALTKIRSAKSQIGGLSAQFSTNANILTNRQDYVKESIKNFSDGADLLTLADINEEGAKLTSLQTRQQLSITALSLANQSDGAILRLF